MLLTLVAWGGAASAASLPPDVAPYVQAALALGRVHAVVVGVQDADSTALAAWGWRDAERQDAVAVTDRFEVGSITKTFTAALLADAVQRGEVAPDASLSTWFDGAPEVTLAQLATHTSGLGRMPCTARGRSRDAHPYARWDAADLAWTLAHCPVERAPGAGWSYSNLGYAALGGALAQAAGAPWSTLLQERVLIPAGLQDGFVLGEPDPARVVVGWDGAAFVAPWGFDAMAPAGALRADVGALLAWGAMHQPGNHGAWASIAAETTAVRAEVAPGRVGIGYAWFRYAEPARDAFPAGPGVLTHSGGTGGFQSFVGLDEGRVVAVLVSGLGADALGFHLLRPERAPLPTLPERAPRDAGALAPYVGRWQIDEGPVLTLRIEGDHLAARVPGQAWSALWPMGEHAFGWAGVEAHVRFDAPQDGIAAAGSFVQGASHVLRRLGAAPRVVAPADQR
jgi:CubicO group peptidase (beta-lactamase class C family)